MNSRLFVLVWTLVWLGLSISSCKDVEEGTTAGASELGQSCESTADCVSGLACFGGACLPSELNITPNNKECAAIQCEVPQECCETAWSRSPSCDSYQSLCDSGDTYYCTLAQGPDCVCSAANYACEENMCARIECQAPADCCNTDWMPPSSCDMYQSYCELDPVSYADYCVYYDSYCVCSAADYDCIENTCFGVLACVDETDCFGDICLNGRCVECQVDDDCSSADATCLNGACILPECETNLDCPAFYECQSGSCEKVGCRTDRECMVYEDSYLAVCDSGAQPLPVCETKCTTDVECYASDNPLRSCVGGTCVDPGCESDEECKILLSYTGTLGFVSGARAVCRDKVD